MTTPTRPIKLHDKNELQLIAIKIPRVLIALLDNAASNDWETRNSVIRRILEKHFENAQTSTDAG